MGLIISVAPCRPNLLLLLFFLPPFLPLAFPSSLHKYLVSIYYVLGLVLASVPVIMNKTVYIILSIEWKDRYSTRICTNIFVSDYTLYNTNNR